ncbi:MAG: hypothetical protein ACRDNW_10385 [Trebonia sp.]
MSSGSLSTWNSARTERIKRLRAAHQALAGTGPGRRWVTEELNQALILRLASEFQGFARNLHDEAGVFVAGRLAPGNPRLQNVLRLPYTVSRKLNQGNADPGTLGNDFGLFGLVLWTALQARYPTRAKGWNQKLAALNMARNGIVHDDGAKVARVQADGWPLTLQSADRWKLALDGLAQGMDCVVGGHLKLVFGTQPW